MKNTFGQNVSITLFGESHGEAIGAVIDGLPAGIKIDNEFIENQLTLRRPIGQISTPRVEKDEFSIVSGVFNGFTTGTPICILIPNSNTNSKDYSSDYGKARPSHADFTAHEKYNGFEDYRGGGHFSGRITAALVAAGAICISALSNKGITIGTHISKLAGISDKSFSDLENEVKVLNQKQFAVLDTQVKSLMEKKIIDAKNNGDSVGGILETAVLGLPCGVGEPWFDSVESLISHALFSIPAVKGVEFGSGFTFADMLGSKANDPFYIENGIVKTATNNNGGINGGITNGMPVIFRCVIKPTPTISKPQKTINFKTMENTELSSIGRHDPCIVHRARVVVDSMTAIVLCDLLSTRFGTDWLANV